MSYIITFYDFTGKVVKTINDSGEKGYNSIILNKNDFYSSGVFTYKLESGESFGYKKMVIIK